MLSPTSMSFSPGEQRTPSLEGSSVLVVDADPDRRKQVASLLQRAGYTVRATASEDTAVDTLEHRPHAILVYAPPADVATAGMCMLNWIRIRHPTTQVVVLTPPGVGGRALQIANSGAVALVHVPVNGDELLQTCSRVLRHHELSVLAHLRQEDDYVRRRHHDALSNLFETALRQLHLVYQPIIRANSGCIVGYEALLRVDTARDEGAGPMLDLARRLGRTAEVDDRVRTLVSILFEETPHPRTIFVNFDRAELYRQVLGSPEDPLMPYASRVVIELGDEGPVPEGPEVDATLRRLRAAGYRLAAGGIAGTVAGLKRLRVLAPDLYKLGGSLVQRADLDPEKRRQIAQLVQLAHGEGALIVAQGIERPEEREVAAELGCDMLQGYLLGMPRVAFD